MHSARFLRLRENSPQRRRLVAKPKAQPHNMERKGQMQSQATSGNISSEVIIQESFSIVIGTLCG
jgi:hypothetical protein